MQGHLLPLFSNSHVSSSPNATRRLPVVYPRDDRELRVKNSHRLWHSARMVPPRQEDNKHHRTTPNLALQ